MIIRCPHCEFSRSIGEHAIPAGAEHVTCPKCKHRFRFRTVDRAVEFDATPPSARSVRPAHEERAPKPADIWDAVDSLHQRWERQMEEQVTDTSLSSSENQPLERPTAETASSRATDAYYIDYAPPEKASVKPSEAEGGIPEKNEPGVQKPPRSAFSTLLNFLPLFSSSRRSDEKKRETSRNERDDKAAPDLPSEDKAFAEFGAKADVEQSTKSGTLSDGVAAQSPYEETALSNADAMPGVPGYPPLPDPDPPFSAPPENVFGKKEDEEARTPPAETLLTENFSASPLLAETPDPHTSLADAPLFTDPSNPLSCALFDPVSASSEPDTSPSPQVAEQLLNAGRQGKTPDASADVPAASSAPLVPVSPTPILLEAEQEPDDAHAFRPLFPYGLDDTPPEERVERDMLRLQSTGERPVKDLGRIEDLMPDEVEDEPYGAVIGEIPWESPEERGWGRGFIDTIRGVMFGAPSFFMKVPSGGGLSLAFLFFLIQGYLAILCSVLWSYAAGTILDIPALYANKANLPFMLLLAPVALGLMLVLSAGGMRLALDLFSPKRVPFSLVGKIVCYSMAPMILSVIPFIGPVAGTVWFFVAMAVAGRQIFSLSWFTSIFCTLPAAAVLVAGMLLFFL